MKRNIAFCMFFVLVIIFACNKTIEKPLPKLEPGEFHIAYADGDSFLVQGKTATLYFLLPAKNDGELSVTFRRDYSQYSSKKIEMRANDSLFHTQIDIPEDAYYLSASANGFGSCYSGSSPSYYEPVYRVDCIPARHARANDLLDNEISKKDALEKEFENYPDNVMAYRPIWFYYASFSPESIQVDIERIKEMDTTNPEKDAALAIGYTYLKDFEKAIDYTERYMKNTECPWLYEIIANLSYNADYSNKETSDLLLEGYKRLLNHDKMSYPISMYMYMGPRDENEELEAILDSLFILEPVSGYLNFMYYNEFLNDTAKTIKFLDMYIEEYYKGSFNITTLTSKRAINQAMKFGAEYYLKNDDIKRASSFTEPALLYADDKQQAGNAALLSAKIARKLNDNENFEKKIQIAAGNGKLAEIEEYLAKEFPDKDTYAMLTDIFAKAIKHNEKAPDYMFVDSKGDTIRPGNGKIQFIHFWNIGCKPCVEEKPALDEFASRHDIDFYAISNSSKEATIEKVGEFSNFANIYEKDVFSAFKITSVPRTYIIDKNGMIRFMKIGTTQGYTDEAIVIKLLEDETISKRID